MENKKEKQYVLNIYNPCTGRREDTVVSEKVFKEYKRSYWREHKNNLKHQYHEIPFSALTTGDSETEACDFYEEFESTGIPIDLMISLSDEVREYLSVVTETVGRRIVLHYSYGFTYEEIASLERVSIETIKECIKEGVKKIRKIF